MRIIWQMSFFELLAKRLCAFVILAVVAPPVWGANSHLALDSDDASPLLAQAETSSGSLEWDILYEEADKLWKQGDYRRGISVARKALEVAETSFGKNDINTGKSINLLGVLYEAQGDYAAAEPLHKRALAIHEKTLGAQHPSTVTDLNNLAALYDSQGDYARRRTSPQTRFGYPRKNSWSATPRHRQLSQQFGGALRFARRLRRRRTSL